jgi:hypothetical protein
VVDDLLGRGGEVERLADLGHPQEIDVLEVEVRPAWRGVLKDRDLDPEGLVDPDRADRPGPGRHLDLAGPQLHELRVVVRQMRIATRSSLAGSPQYSGNFSTTICCLACHSTNFIGPVPTGARPNSCLNASGPFASSLTGLM